MANLHHFETRLNRCLNHYPSSLDPCPSWEASWDPLVLMVSSVRLACHHHFEIRLNRCLNHYYPSSLDLFPSWEASWDPLV